MPEPLRVLIVDDESPARKDIKRMLGRLNGIEVVGEGRNGIEAVKLIREKKPDLVLLDIQMPGLDGFQVLGKLAGSKHRPSVIFVTAYESYALRAFDVHAVDYLLKPVDEKRLEESVERVRQERKGSRPVPDIEGLIGTAGVLSSRLAISHGGNLLLVDIGDILYATVEAGEVVVVTAAATGKVNFSSLDRLESELPPQVFMRVHRSYLANLRQIKEIESAGNGGYRLRMGGRGEAVIPLSRSQARKLRKIIKW